LLLHFKKILQVAYTKKGRGKSGFTANDEQKLVIYSLPRLCCTPYSKAAFIPSHTGFFVYNLPRYKYQMMCYLLALRLFHDLK
jgi:hypothetical protein